MTLALTLTLTLTFRKVYVGDQATSSSKVYTNPYAEP